MDAYLIASMVLWLTVALQGNTTESTEDNDRAWLVIGTGMLVISIIALVKDWQ